MRVLFGLVLPLLLQVAAYVGVFAAARGGGSFMGLVAIPVAAVSLLVLLVVATANVRGPRSLASVVGTSLAIAVVPPVLLLMVRALEG